MRAWLLLSLVAGCVYYEDDVGPNPRDFAVSMPDLAMRPVGDGGALGGTGSGRARPAASAPLHVGANQSVTVPTGEFGFTVTANGTGGYRVAWVDAAMVGYRFHASLFADGGFDGVSSRGMSYATVAGTRLDFESAPGAGQLGYVDFTSQTAFTLDGLVGANEGTLYFPNAQGATVTAPTPATFISP